MKTEKLIISMLILTVLLSGCLGSGVEEEPVKEYQSYVFDHVGRKPFVTNGLQYNSSYTESQNFLTTIVSEEEIDRFNFNTTNNKVEQFIKNTDFNESYLIVFQEFPASSTPDYRIENITRTNKSHKIQVNDSSQGGTSDITIETLLIRINQEKPQKILIITENGKEIQTN